MRVIEDRWLRRAIYALLAIVFAILIFFPQPYLARAKIVPQDTSVTASSTTSLLGALGVGAQGIGSLLTGGRPSNDLYLIIGRSDSVAEDVIRTERLVGPGRLYPTERKAKLALQRKVDIHLLLGGVMEIETKLYDPARAVRLTNAYANAISRQLAAFGRQIIINKQRLVRSRFEDAKQRVARAEAELNAFRRQYSLPDPEAQFGAELTQRTSAQAELEAKQVELQTMRQFRGPESPELLAIQSDIAALRQQIARSTSPRQGVGGPNVTGISVLQTRYLAIFRNLRFQQSIYDVYQRSAEQVAVEEIASGSASYIQIIDPSHLDAERQMNIWAIALLLGVVLLAFFTEWYGPATGLFDRPGDRREADEPRP